MVPVVIMKRLGLLSLGGIFLMTLFVLGCDGLTERRSIVPQEKVYKFAYDSAWYPLDLKIRAVSLVGFVQELSREIGELEDFEAQTVEVAWNAIMPGLYNGAYDGVYSLLDPTDKLKEDFLFSDPILKLGPSLVVPVSSKAESLEDMKGGIIGAVDDSPALFYLQTQPDIIILRYISEADLIQAFFQKKVEAMMIPALQAHNYANHLYKGVVRSVSGPYTERACRLIVRKEGGKELVDAFNEGLARSKKEGEYDQLISKWKLYWRTPSPSSN